MSNTANVKPGEESYEEYFSYTAQAYRIQYDYRTPAGKLFSCIARDLPDAKRKRDGWLKKEAAIARATGEQP